MGVILMAKILIVEDEMLIANGLAAIIKSINKDIDITITGYAKDALEYARANQYDAFLLDIQLNDYSGLELAKEIRNIDKYKMTPILFITAIPTRELMAFKEIHCYDYIIKPFKEEKVRETLGTIINYGIKSEVRKKNLKIDQNGYSYIMQQDEIIYIEYKSRRLIITTVNEVIKTTTYTLYEILEELGEEFVQCHRGYIININYIEKLDMIDNSVKLKSIDELIPIGRKYKDELRGKINEYS